MTKERSFLLTRSHPLIGKLVRSFETFDSTTSALILFSIQFARTDEPGNAKLKQLEGDVRFCSRSKVLDWNPDCISGWKQDET